MCIRDRHCTVICAPGDANTLSCLSLIPDRVPVLVIRTIGNGCMKGREALTGIVSEATLESPSATVTRSCTRWLPGVENGSSANQRVIRSTLGAVRDGLLEVSSPAVFVIGAVTRIYEEIESRVNFSSRQLVEPVLLSTARSELTNKHLAEADITLCELPRSRCV